ncbi:Homocysteine S-methyltransferase 1 [Gaertneriomyces sp. JEL0708]|nr:Homocysteine S-methyltransferase 1 [Gaertneriomyces sp. JEL0708]
MDPEDLVTEGEVPDGPDESVDESTADGLHSPTNGRRSPAVRLSPLYQSMVNFTYTLVVLIVLAHMSETIWILGRYLPNSSKMPPFQSPVPSLAYALLYGVMVAIWIIHYVGMLSDGKEQSNTPEDSMWYQAGPASSRIKGFWVIAFALYTLELYHDVVYSKNGSAIGTGGEYLAASGFMASLCFRITILLLLLAMSVAIDLHHRRRLENGGFVDAEAQGPGTSETPIPDLYRPPTTFSEFSAHFKKLVPFIWPTGKHSLKLKLMIIACFGLLVIGRVVNLLVPLQYKRVVDSLGGAMGYGVGKSTHSGNGGGEAPGNGSGPSEIPYGPILMFVLLRFLSSGVGALNTLQSFLWIPVGQFTTRQISVKMFEHLHDLSLRFHLNRKTGEILRVQDRGVASIVSLFSSILFNIVPTLADITIACFYFTIEFDMYFGFIVFTTMGLYIFCTIVITEWRTKYRRIANLLDNAMEAKAVDSLLNFETVKYYNAEEFEVNQYRKAVKEYQKADFTSSISLSVLNTTQNVIIQVGLLVGCLLCAKRIVYDKTMTVGDFVLYLSYITQLYGPLNWFGNYYRVIQKNFVDMEKMLDLFKEPVEIVDKPDAKPLVVKGGEVVFERVSFAYDPRRPVLDNVSFTVPAGATVALVGPSGSGKSTILRLLFRFYDVQQGSVKIDGQDLRDVQQKTLRGIIGVVPQDTVLFNDSIRYNLRYGRPGASDHDVLVTAEAAQIHDRILSFPDGYETKVGERGLRLSGGEKQRVAIARTLLKNPAIILLDEATSALDTRSEAALQSALLTRSRTTIVIAHRLSTIVNADQILVLKDGRIVERGTHESLMRMRDGMYYDMWMKQLKDEHGLGGLGGSTASLDHWMSSSSSLEEMAAGIDDVGKDVEELADSVQSNHEDAASDIGQTGSALTMHQGNDTTNSLSVPRGDLMSFEDDNAGKAQDYSTGSYQTQEPSYDSSRALGRVSSQDIIEPPVDGTTSPPSVMAAYSADHLSEPVIDEPPLRAPPEAVNTRADAPSGSKATLKKKKKKKKK